MNKTIITIVVILILLVLVIAILLNSCEKNHFQSSKQSQNSTDISKGDKNNMEFSPDVNPALQEIKINNFPIDDDIEISYEDSFLSKHVASFEKQVGPRCGGYSSAYLLRTFGIKATGNGVFSKSSYVSSESDFMPDGVLEALNTKTTKATLYRGNLETMKTRLCKGYPLLTMIGNNNSQHYVNIVGYDNKNIYIVDTNYSTDNSKGYNRKMSINNFLDVWDNCIQPFNNIYFYVEKID